MANQNTTVQFSAEGLQEVKASAIGLLRDLVSFTKDYNRENQATLDILKEQIALLSERNKVGKVAGGGNFGLGGGSGQGQDLSPLLNEVKALKDSLLQGGKDGSADQDLTPLLDEIKTLRDSLVKTNEGEDGQPVQDLTPLLDEIKTLRDSLVKTNEGEDGQPVQDLTPVLNELKVLQESLTQKGEVSSKVDLSPLVEEIKALKVALVQNGGEGRVLSLLLNETRLSRTADSKGREAEDKNLAPLLAEIKSLKDDLSKSGDSTGQDLTPILEEIKLLNDSLVQNGPQGQDLKPITDEISALRETLVQGSSADVLQSSSQGFDFTSLLEELRSFKDKTSEGNELPPIDLTPLMDEVKSLKDSISQIPQTQSTDFSPLIAQLQELQSTFSQKSESQDLSPLLDELKELKEAYSKRDDSSSGGLSLLAPLLLAVESIQATLLAKRGGTGGAESDDFTLLLDEVRMFKDGSQGKSDSIISQLKGFNDLFKTFSLAGSLTGNVGNKALSASIDLSTSGGGGSTPSGSGEGESTESQGDRVTQGENKNNKEGGGNAPWVRELFKAVELLSGALKSEDYVDVMTKSATVFATTIAGNGILGAVIGLPGLAATMAAEALIDLYDKRQEAAQGNVQLFGGTLKGHLTSSLAESSGVEKMGYSYVDILKEKERMSPGLGRKATIEDVSNSFAMQRGAGIDPGLVDGINKTLRGRGGKATDVVGGVVHGRGLGSDFSLLNEHLQALVSVSEKQLLEVGNTNVFLNNKMMSGLSAIDTNLKNHPQLLASVFQKTMDGGSKAKTDQFQALQYRTMDEVAKRDGMEGYSTWDLTKIIQDPTHRLHGQYQDALQNNAYKLLGRENYEQLLQSQYMYGIKTINSMSDNMVKTGGNIKIAGGTGGVQGYEDTLKGRAESAATSKDTRQAEYTNQKGSLLQGELENTVKVTLQAMKDFNDGIFKTVEQLEKTVKKIKAKLN